MKLADFGFARYFDSNSEELMQTPYCTLNYAAPEVLFQATDKKSTDLATPYNVAGYDNSCDVSVFGMFDCFMLMFTFVPL